jgi:hypothetical protein
MFYLLLDILMLLYYYYDDTYGYDGMMIVYIVVVCGIV